MVSPLAGGPARRIAVGMFRMSAGPDGIFWPVAQGDSRITLHTYPPDFPVEVLTDYTGWEAPLQFAGRLYWLGSDLTSADGFPREPSQFHTSLPDGTDHRILLDVDPQQRDLQSLRDLRLHGTALLFFRVTRLGGGPRAVSLCSLRPNDPVGVVSLSGTVAGVSGPFWIDGSSAYFLRVENRENWLDWSPRGLVPRQVGILHRIALPRY
jgi:hypothetical protein